MDFDNGALVQITGSSQPFYSGGSDQCQAHKDDPETGLHYNLARSYSNTLARWISADSLTSRLYNPGNLNKYAYVRNDPVDLVDPDGRNAKWVWCSGYDVEGQYYNYLCGVIFDWGVPDGGGGGIGVSGGSSGGRLDPLCDTSGYSQQATDNYYKLNFIRNNTDDAQALAKLTGLNADFILAWAAMESGWGVGWNGNSLQNSIAQRNNNFFGLTVPQGGTTGGWVGAVPCGEGSRAGFACFNVWDERLSLLPSGWSALQSFNQKYLKAALEAQNNSGGDIKAIAEAIAAAGFNSEGNYGDKAVGSFNAIVARRKCK